MLGQLEHVDLAALVAPRPLLVETGVDDPLFPVDTAREGVDLLAQVYAALGALPETARHRVVSGEHRYDGTEVAGFLARGLHPSAP
jgi:hypothetical protein